MRHRAAMFATALALAAADASAAPALPSGAANATTGVVADLHDLTRALPLKQLRLITPEQGRVDGTDAVTAVFSRAVGQHPPTPRARLHQCLSS